jgi:insecticidal toxin complex protein TccC
LHFIKLVYIGWFGSGSGLIGDNLLKSIGVGAIISHWQQALTIHPNNNRGTENNNQNNFDANGNLLNLNNIGSLEWHYNNTLNKLTKANKPNTTCFAWLIEMSSAGRQSLWLCVWCSDSITVRTRLP